LAQNVVHPAWSAALFGEVSAPQAGQFGADDGRNCGFGKPTVNAAAQTPGIGDFTIVIGDHDARGNLINDLYRD
tara:strand:+ start:170 stop:391 length:222 start_codon:yes stop_codon:yes gene_type:complete